MLQRTFISIQPATRTIEIQNKTTSNIQQRCCKYQKHLTDKYEQKKGVELGTLSLIFRLTQLLNKMISTFSYEQKEKDKAVLH